MLHQQIYNETYVKIGLKIRLLIMHVWLLEDSCAC